MFQSEAFFFGIHNLQIVSFLIGWTDFFVANLFSILFDYVFLIPRVERSHWNLLFLWSKQMKLF